jgi:hypothetical protein
LIPKLISLLPFYILFDPKLVDRGNRIFFQITNTLLCLVENDDILATIGSEEKLNIGLAV